MATPMSVKDVLSVLGQMELDLTQLLAQKRGLTQVREILNTFESAVADLATMETTKAELATQIEALRSDYANRLTAEKKTLHAEQARCATACTEAKQALAAAQDKLQTVQADLLEKERFASDRASQLNADLKAKTAELTRLTAAYEAFKKQHGLAV